MDGLQFNKKQDRSLLVKIERGRLTFCQKDDKILVEGYQLVRVCKMMWLTVEIREPFLFYLPEQARGPKPISVFATRSKQNV